MGLTAQSTGITAFLEEMHQNPGVKSDAVIALAGNPNTGKSTVFNGLTGLKQHTGNWPGKTVVLAKGSYRHKNKTITLVDLPGTYSLLANSADEQVARDFICFGNPNVTVVVADATCLERNLNLALQVVEMTPRTILCVNLMDEAKRKRIEIDCTKLQGMLGIPVIPVTARERAGLEGLKDIIHTMAFGKYDQRPNPLVYRSELESAIAEIQREVDTLLEGQFNSRWVALRLLEGDPVLAAEILSYLQKVHPEPQPWVIKGGEVKCCE